MSALQIHKPATTMTRRESDLKLKTYKEDGVGVQQRVFCTLNGEHRNVARRATIAVAQLMGLLQAKGLISSDELDELLLECTR